MLNTKSKWPAPEVAIAALLVSKQHANTRLYLISRALGCVALMLVMLCVVLLTIHNNKVQFRYILTDTTGVIIPQIALASPNKDDQFVLNWTTDAITQLYTFDYEHFREQMQAASKNLSTQGWENFVNAMKTSGNFEAILGYKYVTTAAPTGRSIIIEQGPLSLGGEVRHQWTIKFPMVISYQSSHLGRNGKALQTEQSLMMTVTVIRVPEFINQNGLGIRSIVAE